MYYLELLVLSSIIGIWTAIISLLYNTFMGKNQVVERLKDENRELRKRLREEVESVKQHYEQLLKDAAVRNLMMSGLWTAYTSGGLQRCFRDNGNPKVLADGTVICDKGEGSYTITGGGSA